MATSGSVSVRAGARGGPQLRGVGRNDTALYCEAMKAGRQTKQPAEEVRRAVNCLLVSAQLESFQAVTLVN